MNPANFNPSNRNQNQINVTEDMLAAVVFETNVVSDTSDWWIDTGATRYICGNKNSFSTYQQVEDAEKLFMENASESALVGRGSVVMKFTYGKELILLNVLHILEIRKNLVS